jgi:hypothetical protein
MMDSPAKGDIWMDDEGHYFLYLTDPVYSTDGVLRATTLWLNTGLKERSEFSFNPETLTLYEWWTKVA